MGFGKRLVVRLKRIFGRKKKRAPRNLSGRGRKADLSLTATPGPSPIAASAEFSMLQLSAHTRRAYELDLKDFFQWLRREGPWDQWTAELRSSHVAVYRDFLIQERKLAKSSVTRKIAVLKSFFRWCVAEGHMNANPAELVRSFPQTQDSKTGFLSEHEVNELLQSISHFHLMNLSRHLGQVIMETLLMLGLRRGELTRIRLGDLHWNDGQWLLRVRGKGDRERLLPILPRLLLTWERWLRRSFEDAPKAPWSGEGRAAWLDHLMRHRDQPLFFSTKARSFHVPLSDSEVAYWVRKLCRKSGIAQRVSPHMLRATAITHALDEGATHRGVQQMAGWTSPLMITRYDKRRNDPRHSAVFQLRYARWQGQDQDDSVEKSS